MRILCRIGLHDMQDYQFPVAGMDRNDVWHEVLIPCKRCSRCLCYEGIAVEDAIRALSKNNLYRKDGSGILGYDYTWYHAFAQVLPNRFQLIKGGK